ncbi:hypothetical protein ACIOJE_35000 [Kitasatospora sp. NPDC087861]|uniref:hypothetical protein n=1 Tax=Kitasatospora sp. NPDC087861 TaxID=3364070 RepID=UPI0037F5C4D8
MIDHRPESAPDDLGAAFAAAADAFETAVGHGGGTPPWPPAAAKPADQPNRPDSAPVLAQAGRRRLGRLALAPLLAVPLVGIATEVGEHRTDPRPAVWTGTREEQPLAAALAAVSPSPTPVPVPPPVAPPLPPPPPAPQLPANAADPAPAPDGEEDAAAPPRNRPTGPGGARRPGPSRPVGSGKGSPTAEYPGQQNAPARPAPPPIPNGGNGGLCDAAAGAGHLPPDIVAMCRSVYG